MRSVKERDGRVNTAWACHCGAPSGWPWSWTLQEWGASKLRSKSGPTVFAKNNNNSEIHTVYTITSHYHYYFHCHYHYHQQYHCPQRWVGSRPRAKSATPSSPASPCTGG